MRPLIILVEFAIKLPVFEGPFELLLYLIERDELDISDIPIAQITDEFLGYIRQMERLNLELASEFILVAATLMKIKARMLLPRPHLDEQGQEIDPREDLIRHLLEYRRYKATIQELLVLEEVAVARFVRGSIAEELGGLLEEAEDEAPLVNLTLTSLALAFQRVLIREADRARSHHHVVMAVPYTVEDCKTRITARLAQGNRMGFVQLLRACRERLEMIYTFMAILEMLNEGHLQLITDVDADGEMAVNGFELQVREIGD